MSKNLKRKSYLLWLYQESKSLTGRICCLVFFFFFNLILLFLRWYFSRFECRNQKWVSIFFFSVNEKFFFHNRKKNYGWWLRKLTTALWGSDYGQQEREIRNKLRKVGHRPSFMHCQKGKYCGGFPSVIGPL